MVRGRRRGGHFWIAGPRRSQGRLWWLTAQRVATGCSARARPPRPVHGPLAWRVQATHLRRPRSRAMLVPRATTAPRAMLVPRATAAMLVPRATAAPRAMLVPRAITPGSIARAWHRIGTASLAPSAAAAAAAAAAASASSPAPGRSASASTNRRPGPASRIRSSARRIFPNPLEQRASQSTRRSFGSSRLTGIVE